MIEGNRKYKGFVRECRGFKTSEGTGTPFLDLVLEADEDDGGTINAPQWINENTRDRFMKTMKDVFGISETQLRDRRYLAERLNDDLIGKVCTFTTKDSKFGVQVGFINKFNEQGEGSIESQIAVLLGGAKVEEEPEDDGGIPFMWLLPTILGGGLYAMLHAAASTLT